MKVLRVLNDTTKPLTLRINLRHAIPNVVKLEPKELKAIFIETEEVLVKLWNRNVLLIQEIEKKGTGHGK